MSDSTTQKSIRDMQIAAMHDAGKYGKWDRLGSDGNTLCRDFESVSSFARRAERNGYQSTSGNTWAGGSLADAVAMATGGGGEAATDAIDAARFNGASVGGSDMVPVWDVSGGDIDMGRLYSGVPECMQDLSMSAPTAPVVSLLVPVTYSASTDKDMVMRRGATIASVLEWSRANGVTLEVFAIDARTYTAGRKSGRLVYTVRVGDSRGCYDPRVVAYTVAHPTMLRRLGFAVLASESAAMVEAVGLTGQGMPSGATPDDLPTACAGPSVTLPIARNRDTELDVDVLLAAVREAATTGVAQEVQSNGTYCPMG